MDQWIIDLLKTGSVGSIMGIMWYLERKERLELTTLLQQAYKDNLDAFHKVEEALKDLTSTITPRKRP